MTPFDEIDRVMDAAMAPFGGWGLEGPLRVLDHAARELESRRMVPQQLAMDVAEHKDRYEVRADVPGVRKEDISLQVEDGVVSLTVERSHEARTSGKGPLLADAAPRAAIADAKAAHVEESKGPDSTDSASIDESDGEVLDEPPAKPTMDTGAAPAAEDEEPRWHRVERSYGRVSRSFQLPEDVDESGIDANLSDGVLTITLPRLRATPERRRSISIH